MNRAVILATSLLATALLPLNLAAQSPSSTDTLSCPVGFTAGHSAGLTAFKATDQAPGAPSQSLRLQLINPGARGILSARITLHGLTPRSRITPVGSPAAEDAITTKQLDLKLSVDAKDSAATDLRITGFTSVQRIDIDSLTYADGSTWTASSKQHCSIVPNGMMMVAAN